MENRSALEMPALAQALSLAAVCLPQDGCAYDRITLDIVLATAANLLRHNRPENEVRLAILWQLPASAAEQLVPEHLRPDLKALAVFFDRTLDFLAADEPLEPDDIERQADEILAPIPDAARIVAAVHLKAIVDRSPKRVFYAADRPEPDRALFFTRLLALAKTFAAGTSDLSGERLLLSVKAAIRSARLKQTLLPDEMDDRIWLFQIRQEVPTEKREAILKRLDKFLSALWLKVGCVPGKNGEGTDPWRNDALYVLLEEARAENTPRSNAAWRASPSDSKTFSAFEGSPETTCAATFAGGCSPWIIGTWVCAMPVGTSGFANQHRQTRSRPSFRVSPRATSSGRSAHSKTPLKGVRLENDLHAASRCAGKRAAKSRSHRQAASAFK